MDKHLEDLRILSIFLHDFFSKIVLIPPKYILLTKFVYPSTLYLPPLLTLNMPFLFYLSTPLALVKLCLFSSPLSFSEMSSEMLHSMTKVDQTDSPLHAFE